MEVRDWVVGEGLVRHPSLYLLLGSKIGWFFEPHTYNYQNWRKKRLSERSVLTEIIDHRSKAVLVTTNDRILATPKVIVPLCGERPDVD